MTCGLLLQAPCRQPFVLAGLKRPSGRAPSRGVTPSTIMSPDQDRSEHRDKAGRQRAPLHPVRTIGEVVPLT